jgi:DNA topoisomerase III
LSYRLVIAEKPSVGAAYAKVLGATNRQDGYWEGNGYLVSWCIGHLVELAPPNVYDEKFVKWSVADLPILPERWQYLVSASTKKQFGILKKLMNRPDVDSVTAATDAGREGELIFRLVYQQTGCKKPVFRLWLSSMEESAIREGFANLKPSTEYDALYNAALCRERADWMVGINASRLFSCLYGRPLAVGRVMTPVLAMTVVREAEIAAFIPEKFYTVAIEFAGGGTASSRRFSQKADAVALLTSCRKEAYAVVQDVERKEKSENPPQLYDLTTLQRDANRLLGFTAQQTLNYAQSLYEKRLITYPRTDSRFLTEDMAESLPGLASGTAAIFGAEEKLLVHVQQVINGSKVTDHHALLPTASVARADLSALPAGEMSILRLIAARLLCAVGEPYRYAETVLTTICAGEEFSAKGKVVLDEGWKSIEHRVLGDLLSKKKEFAALPDVQRQSRCSIAGAELKEGQTSPPKHYNEDLLLSAMQSAGADSMEDDVERTGIGTPATRAATIEKLVQKGFLERKGDRKSKILLPTEKGRALVTVMPEQIQSPEMTADWENKLLRIERGEMEPEEFMTEIKEMVSSLVNTTEAVKGANALMKNKVIGACPNCGTNVVEREKGWFCENRECRFALWKDNAYFKRLGKHLDGRVVDKLLRDGRVRLKDCKSAKGKTYNATVLLSAESDGRSKFSLEFENGGC